MVIEEVIKWSLMMIMTTNDVRRRRTNDGSVSDQMTFAKRTYDTTEGIE